VPIWIFPNTLRRRSTSRSRSARQAAATESAFAMTSSVLVISAPRVLFSLCSHFPRKCQEREGVQNREVRGVFNWAGKTVNVAITIAPAQQDRPGSDAGLSGPQLQQVLLVPLEGRWRRVDDFGKGGSPPGCHDKGLEAMTSKQSTSLPVHEFHFGGRPISIERAAEGWKPRRVTLRLGAMESSDKHPQRCPSTPIRLQMFRGECQRHTRTDYPHATGKCRKDGCSRKTRNVIAALRSQSSLIYDELDPKHPG
jgi:hypothetical protein